MVGTVADCVAACLIAEIMSSAKIGFRTMMRVGTDAVIGSTLAVRAIFDAVAVGADMRSIGAESEEVFTVFTLSSMLLCRSFSAAAVIGAAVVWVTIILVIPSLFFGRLLDNIFLTCLSDDNGDS